MNGYRFKVLGNLDIDELMKIALSVNIEQQNIQSSFFGKGIFVRNNKLFNAFFVYIPQIEIFVENLVTFCLRKPLQLSDRQKSKAKEAKKMKRVITLLVMFAVVLSMGESTAAANAQGGTIGIQPLWSNVNSITLSMNFSGTTVTCSGLINGTTNVSSITATFVLRRVNTNGTLTTLRTWSNITSNTRILTFTDTYSPVNRGQTYRLDVTAVVTTTTGARETVSDFIIRTYN
jgi:hypothetical protein